MCYFLLWFVVSVIAVCQDHRARFAIVKVIDGDTVSINVSSFMPPPLNTTMSVRVRGVDTPESGSRAQCPEEALLASAATAFTQSMVARYEPLNTGIRICGWDKYGGRVLGDIVFWDDDGSTTVLSVCLLRTGHAVEYSGHGLKNDWCAHETGYAFIAKKIP